MNDIVVRTTLKFIYAAYVGEVLLMIAIAVAQYTWLERAPWWTPLAVVLLILWTATRHMRRLTAKLTITVDKLRYETGMLSRSTRTIQLAKVQDVRVDQSVGQRIFGVGSLSIETAGESSRLTVHDIDRPQQIADEIMNRSEHALSAKQGL